MLNRTFRYITSILISYIFLFFIIAFVLASIVFSITLASTTAYIKLSVEEFITLYLLQIPQLIYYILPASFVAGGAVAWGKMALELEVIVFLSLKGGRKVFWKPLSVLALLIGMFVLLCGLILFPLSKNVSKNILETKKSTAELTLGANEFGQKFGDWLIFVDKPDNSGAYTDIALYKNDPSGEHLILAPQGNVLLNDAVFDFTAFNGIAYAIGIKKENNEIGIVEFKKMNLAKGVAVGKVHEESITAFWSEIQTNKTRAKDFALAFIFALFPLIALPWIFLLGFFNPRYEKNRVVLKTFGFTLGFLVSAFILATLYPLFSPFLITFLWGGIGILFYHKKIARYY